MNIWGRGMAFTKNEVSPPYLGLPELKVLEEQTVQVFHRFQVLRLWQPLRFQGDTQSSQSLHYFCFVLGRSGHCPAPNCPRQALGAA